MTSPIKSPWLTRAEAAAYARKSEHAVWLALTSGELRGNQTSKYSKWIIHVHDVDAWIRGEVADVQPPVVTRRRPA